MSRIKLNNSGIGRCSTPRHHTTSVTSRELCAALVKQCTSSGDNRADAPSSDDVGRPVHVSLSPRRHSQNIATAAIGPSTATEPAHQSALNNASSDDDCTPATHVRIAAFIAMIWRSSTCNASAANKAIAPALKARIIITRRLNRTQNATRTHLIRQRLQPATRTSTVWRSREPSPQTSTWSSSSFPSMARLALRSPENVLLPQFCSQISAEPARQCDTKCSDGTQVTHGPSLRAI